MNKKFELLFRQYCLTLHLSAATDEVWDSSAKVLDTELQKRGITLPQPLFHKYKLPNGVSQSDYLAKKNSLNTIGRYKSGDMEILISHLSIKDPLKIEYLKLSQSEKIDFDKYLTNLAKQENKKIDIECQKIRLLNPELLDLNVPNNIDFLSGVVYGFPPADIKYFIDLQTQNLDVKQNTSESENQRILSQQLGLPISYRMSTTTINAIRTAMKTNGLE